MLKRLLAVALALAFVAGFSGAALALAENWAKIVQGDKYEVAAIIQDGYGNDAKVVQDDNHQLALIYQDGAGGNNFARIHQNNDFQVAVILQGETTLTDQIARIVQNGENNYAFISQNAFP